MPRITIFKPTKNKSKGFNSLKYYFGTLDLSIINY